MRPQNTRDWSWQDLISELKCNNIVIDPATYPWEGEPNAGAGGDIIIFFSEDEPEDLVDTFNVSYSDAVKMLEILKELDERCKSTIFGCDS